MPERGGRSASTSWSGAASPRTGATSSTESPTATPIRRAPPPAVGCEKTPNGRFATPKSEPAGTGVKRVYWVLGLILAAYAVSLFVRANGAGWTWLDGWGVSTFELVASVLVIARAARSDRYKNFAIVLGMRWPAAWAFILLTKISPGVGLLWFAVRREWRNLAIALGVTSAIAAVSFVLAPNLWSDFLAASFLDDPVIGAYVTGNPTAGIRRASMANSSFTYANIKDGTLTDLNVIGPCPIDSFNSAAFGALSASNPTQPLPPEYPSDKAFFTVTFFYNESPR